MPFVWVPDYELGIAEIDDDHRLMVGLINELYEAIRQERGFEVMNRIMDRLLDYAPRHFQTEESLMDENGFPQAEDHKQEHRRFATIIEEMERRRRESQAPAALELIMFLSDWLRNHVAGHDRELGIFLAEAGTER